MQHLLANMMHCTVKKERLEKKIAENKRKYQELKQEDLTTQETKLKHEKKNPMESTPHRNEKHGFSLEERFQHPFKNREAGKIAALANRTPTDANCWRSNEKIEWGIEKHTKSLKLPTQQILKNN